jgi:uncharacterized protein involved in exopolysaccharide biosynthesis
MTNFERVGDVESRVVHAPLSPPLPTNRRSFDTGISSAWMLAILLQNRLVLAGVTLVVLLISGVLLALSAPVYAVMFSFLPQTAQPSTNAGLAALAGQFGLPIGGLSGSSQPPQFYADLLETREVLEPIARDSVAPGGARRLATSEFLHVRGGAAGVVDRTVDVLRSRVVSTSVATRTTGVVSVVVRTSSPAVSLEIAKRLLTGLNEFNVVTRQSQAGAERRFIEGRLRDARTTLRSAEDALQSFLQANRQLGNAPQLLFTQQRLEREVSLQQQVVVGLSQQYEDARIREVRDTPVITMIDQPHLPLLPEPLHRFRSLVVAAFVGLSAAAAFVIMRAGWQRRREIEVDDPGYAMLDAEWQRLRPRARQP